MRVVRNEKAPARQCTGLDHHEKTKRKYISTKVSQPLTGSRCQCSVCGQFFNSVSVFDRHRTGVWRKHVAKRRCLTVDEMVVRGWIKNAGGFWIQRKRGDVRRRIDDRKLPYTVATGSHGGAVYGER